MEMKASKYQTSHSINLPEDIGIATPDEAPFRCKLHYLFSQIEKEFEHLYLENLNLQDKLDNFLNKDFSQSYERSFITNSPSSNITNGAPVSAINSTTVNHDDTDPIGGPINVKNSKSKFTLNTGKVKTSHKIKVQTSRIVSSFKTQSVVSSIVREFCGHKDGVWQVAVKTGQPIIGTASADHTACIWSTDNRRCLLQYTGHTGSVNSIKFHQSRDLVLTSSGDGTSHIWQAAVNWETPKKGTSSEEDLEEDDELVENRERIDTLRTPLCEFSGPGGHVSIVVAADWLPNMDQIITGSWDRTAILWDVETREPLQLLTGHDHELTHVSAHSNQRLVVTASRDSTFRLWDFRDPIPVVSVFQGHTESVTATVFSRNDKVISGSDDRTVKVWELRNMRSALTTIRTDASVNRLDISNGGIIAIPQDNRQIRLFDMNGQRIARLPRNSRQGHRRMVSSVVWVEEPLQNCDLFSSGFDRHIFGWSIVLPKDIVSY